MSPKKRSKSPAANRSKSPKGKSFGNSKSPAKSPVSRSKSPAGSRSKSPSTTSLTARKGRKSSPKKMKTSKGNDPERGSDSDDENIPHQEPNLRGEYMNIFILLVLYTLQGVPMGFAAMIPLLMKERGISYSIIGVFSLTHWPFSLKLLWAPIVDSVYSEKIGRRKTWLLPTQLLIGILLIYISYQFDLWTGGAGQKNMPQGEIHIYTLTLMFTMLYFLCATQDIAVDGWALTILRQENVGYQSMCNAAGQTFGYAFAYIGALCLNSLQIMEFDSFMFYFGIAFIIVTVLIGLFKEEKPVAEDEEVEGLKEVYQQLANMWKLVPIKRLVLILLLWKVPFTGCESIGTLKMQEKGIPKEHIAVIGSACTILSVFVPVLVSKWTSGPRPLDVNSILYVPRILLCFLACYMIHVCPNVVELIKENDTGKENSTTTSFWQIYGNHFPYVYYFIMMLTSAIGVIVSTAGFVGQMSFYARVSPKDVGGTYMTLLNTFSNMGGMWCSPLMYWLVDVLTVKNNASSTSGSAGNDSDVVVGESTIGAFLNTIVSSILFPVFGEIDGFYLMTFGCGILGLIGYPLLFVRLNELQKFPKSSWRYNQYAQVSDSPKITELRSMIGKVTSSGKVKK